MLTEGADQPLSDSEAKDPDFKKIARWVAEVTAYEHATRPWRDKAKKIFKRYRDERSPNEENICRFNILWSITKTLQPALLARTPKPDIQRRFKDDDPVGRVTSDVLERCAAYFCQEEEFMIAMKQAVDDYLLPGRASAWVRYVPHFRPTENPNPPEEGQEITDDEGDPDEADESAEEIEYEEVDVDFVHHDDFGHNVCRVWQEVWCVWRKAYLTRPELVRRFGNHKGNLPPLDYKPKVETGSDTTIETQASKSVIYELWDKSRGIAVWFHKDIPEALDVRHDPLGLDGFFPCPRPLYATVANDSLVPIPDYCEYQDQALELDELTSRIAAVTKSLKVAGVYDASAQGLEQLLSEGLQNKLIPVESWAMFAEKGGIKGAVDWLPLDQIAAGLASMYEAREKVKGDLYEITGIADILRGVSDPEETASAQEIKSNYGSMRLGERQGEVQVFIRGVVRLVVDVIAQHFSMETIKEISGVRLFTAQEKAIYAPRQQVAPTPPAPATPPLPGAPVQPPPQMGLPAPNQAPVHLSPGPMQAGGIGTPTPLPPPATPSLPPGITPDQLDTMLSDPTWEEVESLIRNKALRCFRVDIETDSTIKADQQAEKRDRVEFLQAAGGFLDKAVVAGAQTPELVPLLSQMLMFGIRAFPVGKELEGAFDSAIKKLEKAANNPQPKPNPEMMKVQGQLQLDHAKAQSDAQADQAKAQSDAQIQQSRIQGDIAIANNKANLDMQLERHRAQLEDARERDRMRMEFELENRKLEAQIQMAHITANSHVEAAHITSRARANDAAAGGD